jgi:hypothetical protein
MTDNKELPPVTLGELIQRTPDFKWFFDTLNRNSALTLNDINILLIPNEKSNTYPFVKDNNVYGGLSENSNITPEFIRTHPDTKYEKKHI